MNVIELGNAQAARWVWDSLWSARRHARIDVLDVVLFDEVSAGEREAAASSPSLSIESSTPPCPGMRWLFTAKNGQIMKKSSHNTSLGALKQALLDRALLRRGSSEGKSISAYPTNGPHSSNSSVAGGCVFATALLRSGESVPLNEDSWTALVVREGGREGGAVAVIALAPTGGGQGVETSRRGGATPQRFTCEYRAKLNNRRTPLARAKSVAATGLAVTEKPIEASMATYVLVARGLLRDADGQQSEPRHDQDEEKHHARGEAIETGTSATAIVLDERLLSRAKATNREVEATLRAVVQWVQDTRGVYVLSMAATFIVVPPSGNSAGKPQVWLEQALQVRMVHKNGTAPAPMHAPIAEPPRVGSVDRQDPVAACHGEKFSEQEEGGTACRPSTEGSDNAIVRVGTTKTTSAPPAPSASDAGGTATSLQRPPLPPLPMTTASASADHLPGAGAQLKSTAEMLSAVADAVLSASQSPGTTAMQAQPLRSTDGAIVDAAQLQQDTVGGARGNWRRPLAAATVRVKCSGDFCAYYGGGGEGPGPPERLPPKDTLLQDSTGTAVDSNREAASRDGKVEAGVDWTDVGMSDGKSGAALLEVRNKRQGPPLPGDTEPDKDSRGMLFSLMFKSVGLARVEAKQGRDAYWGEDLRRCWRESGCRAAGGLEELSPALIYQEVAVCRSCYEVYRRLDKLRGRPDRVGGGGRNSSSPVPPFPRPAPYEKRQELLASIDATAASRRRAAAAEAGAVTLRAEVAEMLKDVDARTGKLGIEAGIIWRRRLSKRRSSPGAEAFSGISQARLMDKLAQPKLPSLEEEQQQQQQQQSMNSADAGRSARRPSLKRRVKSQGDIPESGFPLLPRRRRTGPASAATTRVRAGERVADGATRRTLPPGPPMRSAWPLQEDGRGMVPRRYGGSVEKLQDGGGGGGDGGGGDEGDIRSTANISAIEAMLEEGGGDAYLPARARDLPEAVAILGPSSPGSSSSSRKGRPRGTEKTTRGSRCGGDTNNAREQDDQSPEGNESLDAPSENNRSADGRTERTSCSGIASSREKRCDGAEERFLHPWQRALEASKRAIKSRAEEHEAALLREKRRRSEARRAAAVSEDCQKARRRVAARLGRTKQRRHRHRHRHRRSAESSHDVVRGRKRQTPQLELGRESTRFNIVGEDWEGSRGSSGGEARLREAARRQHTGDCGDGSHDHDGYLHQMRDALGWARRTLAALVQRLRDRGVGIDKPAVSVADGERPAKDWEVVRVVNKLRRRLAAFEDVEKTAATTAAAGAADGSRGPAVVGESSEFLLLRTRCEAACESFEIEFGHMIDELIATAKAHPSNLNLHLSHVEGDTDGGDNSPILTPSTAGSKDVDDHQPPGASSAASAATQQPTRTVGTATFGLCPSCSVLPVARRCLGCEGSHADRSRCSSCFVREHREPPRHLHRFLRISGGSGDAQDASGDGGGDRAWPKQHLGVQGGDNARVGNSETQGNGSGSGAGAGAGARCSRCGDLAAARRCRECRVDACAACHFLAHRSPSRRSHVVEFVGETAVAVQETLHSRNQLQSVAAAAAAAAAAVDGGRGEEGAGDEGAVGPATFGEDAAQSLAQVRRTIDAPVVRPRSQASTERGSVSFGRDDGDGGSSECSQEQDLSDEAKSGGETSAEGATGSARDDREGEQGEQGDEVSGVTQDIVRGGSDATATATFGGFIEGGDDNSSDGSEGRPNRDADPRQGGRHVGRARYAQGVLEGIHEEREDELEQEQEGSADSSVYSSSDEDTDDEGMMWSPINIAKVGAVEKESTSPSPPPPPEHTTPSSVAKTSENGQVFETGNAISPPSLGGDPGKREGVAAGKSEETNDATSGRRVREGGAQDPSMTEQAPSATHQAVTRDKDLIVGKAVDGTGESMHVPLQVAASKSERR